MVACASVSLEPNKLEAGRTCLAPDPGVGAGATYLALTNAVGCDLSERAPQAETPKGGAPSTPKVSHLPNASPAPREAVRAFRSRPDLNPPSK